METRCHYSISGCNQKTKNFILVRLIVFWFSKLIETEGHGRSQHLAKKFSCTVSESKQLALERIHWMKNILSLP